MSWLRVAGVLALGALQGCASETPERPTLPVAAPEDVSAQGPFLPELDLSVCAMSVRNAPMTDRSGRIENYAPLIVVNRSVILATAPADNACLSSGFGLRGGRNHDGIDLQSRPASMIYSGGPGVIREVGEARGYGLYIVIDHGSGVFTRYAHLANFAPYVREGLQIGFGQPLGLMGDTGNATAVHLHYEVLTGQWGPRKSWGLTPTNPLSWPAYDWEAAAS